MKYGLKFRCEIPVVVPVNYNRILQAAILSWIDEEGNFSVFLHDEGYERCKRKYKLFTFSNIKGNYVFDRQKRTLTFDDEINIVLSFYDDESHRYILKNVRERKPIKFGEVYCTLIGCAVAEERFGACVVDTMSPITVHSTFDKPGGGKLIHFYEPDEKGFEELIAGNLLHKIEAFFGEPPIDSSFIIRPYGIGRLKKVVTYYGGQIIKGWQGRFFIDGSPEMIKMALLSGIGDKNSIGFGCVLQNNNYKV